MQYISGIREFQIPERTVVSIGKFDGLHRGHQKLLKEMDGFRKEGYRVAIFTFSTPPASLVNKKEQTMIMTNEERRELLAKAGVDYLVEYPFDEKARSTPPEEFVRHILVGQMGAKAIVTGPDCHFGYKAAGNCMLLEKMSPECGYRYRIVDKERDGERIISSTYVREMLAEGNMKKANDLLGYRYYVSGAVLHGASLGHEKLYPTANVIPPASKHFPRFGVYVTRVTAEGNEYRGLTNVGRKPTVGDENPVGVETYLYDFSGNLYGKEIKVEFLDFIRPEKKFGSLAELKAQLDHDIRACRNAVF